MGEGNDRLGEFIYRKPHSAEYLALKERHNSLEELSTNRATPDPEMINEIHDFFTYFRTLGLGLYAEEEEQAYEICEHWLNIYETLTGKMLPTPELQHVENREPREIAIRTYLSLEEVVGRFQEE